MKEGWIAVSEVIILFHYYENCLSEKLQAYFSEGIFTDE